MSEYSTVKLYESLYEALKILDDSQYRTAMDAIFEYAFHCKEYDGDDVVVKLLFTTQKPILDKYQRRCKANQSNGQDGGRPQKDSFDVEAYKNKGKNITPYKKK